MESPEAVKGFVLVGALKLNVLDDGGVKACCCTPLTPFAPKVDVVELDLGKNEVDWRFEKEEAVGAGLVPG